MANYKLEKAPWQTNDSATIKLAKAPWESSGVPTQLGIPTVQEMHPDISTIDRIIVKNFGSDNPLDTISYLKSKYPKMEVTTGDGGQIIMRNPGETEYKVLDPDTGVFSSDVLRDLADVGYDIFSGTASGALTALAGLAGGAAGGLGAIPAAIGMGGASSAGLEAIRQAIGTGIGARGEMNPTEIGVAGAIGAASPLLMGTGASAKQIAKGIPLLGIAAPKAGSQAGLLRRASDALFYRGGEAMSGARREVIRNMEKKYPQIKQMETASIANIAEDTADDLAARLLEVEKTSWRKFESSLAKADEQVDFTEARKYFDDLEAEAKKKIANVSQGATVPTAYVEDLAAIKAEKESIFPQAKKIDTGLFDVNDKPITTTIVPPMQYDSLTAADINRKIAETAAYSKLKPHQTAMTSRLAGMSDATRRSLAIAADKAYRSVNSQIETIAEKWGGATARANYKETVNLHRNITPYFKDAQTTVDTLTGLSRKGRAVLAEKLKHVDKKFGTKLGETALDLETLMTFGRPQLLPLSALGATSTSRSLLAAVPASLVGGTLGGYAGSQVEGGRGTGILGMGVGSALGGFVGGPAAIKQYIRARLIAQKLGAGLRDIPYGMPTTGIPTALYGMSGGNQ